MRVLFLSRTLEYGGAERQFVALAAGLARKGHAVKIVSMYDLVTLGAVLPEAGVDLDIVGKRGRWDNLGFAARLVRKIRSWKPDVIHTYMPLTNFIGTVLKPFFPGVPLVWGLRSSDLDLSRFDRLTRTLYKLEPRFSRAADLIIVNSQAGYDHAAMRGYRMRSMITIPNGFDVDGFRPDPEGRVRLREGWGVGPEETLVGQVGRLDPFKDHPTFLAAAAQAAQRRSDVRFVVVGDGPPGKREELLALAERHGVTQRIIFEPARKDVRAVYSALDVFCSSSSSEGFPNVIAEAMACGTPAIATDAGDSASIVGDTGWIVPRGDAASMADAIVGASVDDDLRNRARARVVSEFSVGQLVERTETALRAVVERA